ncbi:MAG: hypothetical protein A3F90_10580 [Deltaproteobacteria bacterium RIFCSPLOWO2_12_FULL_60_19]|nr:MAG: hypothetical protein A3F90_10580 [Deltaproteobacteria bacterium RIFCSPLOWO2_12_FULL_60_19]
MDRANGQRKTAYERWIEQEGIPVVAGYGVRDVRELALGPWKRLGGRGAYVQMKGLEGIASAMPGSSHAHGG